MYPPGFGSGINTIAQLMGAAYGNYPGSGQFDERELGSGYAPTGGPGQQQQFLGPEAAGRLGGGGGLGGPMGSNIPGYSYRAPAGSVGEYHEQIPMGGTPGVWAIRNDELLRGPQRDAWWIDQAKRRHRGRSGFNNRFRNRRFR